MLRSMTAYGRSSLKLDIGHFTVEIQSVNRKYLEVSVNLPSELSHFEIEVKKWISSFVTRGSINVKITAFFENKTPFVVRPNLALAKQLKQAWEQIAEHLDIEDDHFKLSLLSNEKELMIIEDNREDEDLYRNHLKNVVETALKEFMSMKESEGAQLQIDISNRLEKIQAWIRAIATKTPTATQKFREKLMARLEEVLPGRIENEERILREVAVYAEKIDIAEELTRFDCHLTRFDEVMHSKEPAVAKTLEFIIQELNREINTTGSKSSDMDIAVAVIDIKSELERIREQIQNVE